MNNTGAAPCRQCKRSPEIPPQWRTRYSTSTVISTVGSGAPKSHSSNGTRRNEAGDLGAQSLNSADTSLAIPACIPARDDRAAGSVKGNTFPPCTRHPERQRKISVSRVSEDKASQYQWTGRRVPGPGMTGSRVIHGMYRDSSPGVRMTGGAGRKAGSVFVPPVRNERVFLSPAPSRKPFANSFLSLCISLSPCRVGNLLPIVFYRYASPFPHAE
jgi:hypothetical protein